MKDVDVKEKSPVWTKILFGFIGLMILALILLITHSFYEKATSAITLANSGVAVSAKVVDRWHRDTYLISYDGNKTTISIPNGSRLIGSNVPVLYEKNDPKVVLLGTSKMGAWELYIKNSIIIFDLFLLILLAPACCFLWIICRILIT